MHLKEDKENALEEMIQKMKKHMCMQFGSMTITDTKVVMGHIKDSMCNYLRECEGREEVMTTDPEEETPSGEEILRHLPPDQRYSDTVKSKIISLFDHMQMHIWKKNWQLQTFHH